MRPLDALVCAVAAIALVSSTARAQQTPTPSPQGSQEDPTRLPELSVTAPARLPGAPLPLSSVPATVNIVPADRLRGSGAVTLQEALSRLPGVTLSDQQGNSWQMDLSLRGFRSTSVTGESQGLSVFVDGVRVNEPGVEEVHYDLLPLDDIDRIEVIRGPAAVFGRNTLGGAINIITRRGAPPAYEIAPEVEGGSFGRQKYRLRVGGASAPLDYYVSGTFFREDGWRDVAASRIEKLFAKLGLESGGTDASLSFQRAENRIEQPGSLPFSDLRRDRTLNYTGGDFFKPHVNVATASLRQELGASFALSLMGFGRWLDSEQFNVNQAGPNTRSFTTTTSAGGAAQLSHEGTVFERTNRLVFGVDYAHHDVRVRVFEEVDGARGPESDVRDNQPAVAVFLQDTLDIARNMLRDGDRLIVTAAVRWDWLRHDIEDRDPVDRPSSSGVHEFNRANPAIGFNYNLSRALGFYFGYSEGFRAPGFLELTCAGPGAVCPGLQAGVAPDPPLKAVKARNYELGVRAHPAPWLEGELALFRTDVIDDIFSVSPTGTTGLFFQNVGNTRRQGVELSLGLKPWKILEARLSYTYTEATFRNDLVLATPRLTAGCAVPQCTQNVRAADDLPLVPRHRLNASLDYHPTSWLTLWIGGSYVGAQRLRGDEANEEQTLGDYVVVNGGVRAQWKTLEAFVTVNNLLNNAYETFGTFAPNGKVAGAPVERFLTPAAPINVLAGVSYRF